MNPKKVDFCCDTKYRSCSGMTQEQARKQIELLTDLIEIRPGVGLRDLHPEMSTQELAERGFQLVDLLRKIYG